MLVRSLSFALDSESLCKDLIFGVILVQCGFFPQDLLLLCRINRHLSKIIPPPDSPGGAEGI